MNAGLRRKPLDEILAAADGSHGGLKRVLGPLHVTLLGVGAIVGAGIFATVGTAAAGDASRPGAGPSIVLSFAITAAVCALTALCYAEMASMVPISGSAYTYAYATMGELVAWVIGWDLIIEYAVGNVAVAVSWANYFRTFLEEFGIHVPLWLSTDLRSAQRIPGLLDGAPHLGGVPIVVNVFAAGIVFAITVLLVWGIRESARFNAVMVSIKLAVLCFFVAFGWWIVAGRHDLAASFTPFQPNGWAGTLAGAAVVFFAYIGFDAVSTVAEETRRPSRDLPIGIIASLALCTLLYIVVSATFTAMIPYGELRARLASEQAEPLTMAIQHAAPGAHWAAALVALGSVVAHTAVLLVFQLGQPRIFFSMARDGLLPQGFARVHRRFGTPHVTTILSGIFVGGVAAFASIDEMVDLTNIGTLFAFVLVSLAIPILRFTEPHRERPFRVPGGPFLVPLASAAACLFLMFYLPPASWWRFIGWLALGLSVYAGYGRTHSLLSGAHPHRAGGALRVASLGMVLCAVGLFALPHDRGFLVVFHALEGGRAAFGTFLGLAGAAISAAAVAVHTRGRAVSS